MISKFIRYVLTCQSYKVYIGQTGRNLTTRYKKHIRNIRFIKDESAFAQHILNKRHQYGPMTEILDMVEHAKKGNLVNIKENFYIFHFNKFNKLIEEQKHTKESETQNSMFDIIIKHQYTPTQRHEA
jgi:predicted GIY-YIG superfamily endonuclease